MMIASVPIEMEHELVRIDIHAKPKQNRMNLKPALDYAHRLVHERNRERYQIIFGSPSGAPDFFCYEEEKIWNEIKQDMKYFFGYRLIKDIPYEKLDEVNQWCIQEIEHRFKNFWEKSYV